MPDAYPLRLLERFVADSLPAAQALAAELGGNRTGATAATPMAWVRGGRREAAPTPPPDAYILRTSVEYANPQLTLEELQGIVLARMLEVTAGWLAERRSSGPIPPEALAELSGRLARPSEGRVRPFLMNVDDVEPDRYSINPLRSSLLTSGQSARAAASVELAGLSVDPAFFEKYRGTLVADKDRTDIEEELARGGSYVDFVDRVKYRQLERASEATGIDLVLPSVRMPIETLRVETSSGPLSRLLSACHRDVETLKGVYGLFGRELKRRKTLLPLVPHSPNGAASKRASRGKLLVDETRITGADVRYTSAALYPNDVDPADVARAVADERFSVSAEHLTDYDFRKTPGSPQFALYMLASPEDGAIWHGVGQFAGLQVVQSYAAVRRAFGEGRLFPEIPLLRHPKSLQWDLVADRMLVHPGHHNIDASVASLDDVYDRLPGAMSLRLLEVTGAPPTPEAAEG